MLNIAIIGGGPSINKFDKAELKGFLKNCFTIAINHAYKYFPHDVVMAQDYDFIKQEAEGLKKDTSLKLFRDWRVTRPITSQFQNCILLDNALACRNLTGILAVDLAAQWAQAYDLGKIYLFGFDHKANGHFHNSKSIPESACVLKDYAPLRNAPCVNMCADSIIPYWPKESKIPEIEPTTAGESVAFLSHLKAWLNNRKYIRGAHE